MEIKAEVPGFGKRGKEKIYNNIRDAEIHLCNELSQRKKEKKSNICRRSYDKKAFETSQKIFE